MIINEMTPEEVAQSKEIPLAAVREAIDYCETHQELLRKEAEAERRYLEERGVVLEPPVTH